MEKLFRILGFRYVTAALMLLAVAALYGAASLSRPGEPARAVGREAPVSSAVSVCPGLEGTRLSLLTTPGKSSGRVDVAQTRDGRAVGSLASAGTGWSKDLSSARDSFTVRANGELAAGMEPEQTTHWPKGPDRGLAGTRCARPGTDLWFTGPGPAAAEKLDLYLTNVDDRAASVDVTALSGEGPLNTVDGQGTAVEPYSTKVVPLGKSPEGLGSVLETARELGLRVRATNGRVAAAVRVRSGKKKGIDWLPLSPAPATSVVVPGVPSGQGRRQLLVAVPGEADARIKVQVLTSSGVFYPQGQDVMDAAAESVTTLDLDRALSGKPGAARLVSDRPIVAGFTAQRGADIAFGTSVPSLGAAGGVVADNRYDSTVTLSAPNGAAAVRITAVGGQGPGTPQSVKVPADRTVEVKVAGPRGSENGYGTLIVPQAGSGPVHAVRTMSTGRRERALVTVLPDFPVQGTVRLPPVGESQTAVFP